MFKQKKKKLKKDFKEEKNIELIILARGGGSLEDLWPFNEEIVAKSIFACKVPFLKNFEIISN